jgi:dTDP-4-dehydrorhamnose reductase
MYIVLGKNGYIAEAVIKELKSRSLNHIALSRSDLDYTDFKKFSDYAHINHHNYEKPFKNATIINCAGYIGKPNVDACEQNKGDTIMGNVVFPTNLANFCSTNDATLVQVSSGCIYNGHEKSFTEEDEPNFTFQNGSFYSGSKALCEKMILKHNPRSYIFRLRIPFDEVASPRNYLTKLLNYDRLLNAENSLSHRGDFSRNCIDLLEAKVPRGIYNVSNKGSVTTKEVVALLKKYNLSRKEFKFFKSIKDFSKAIIAPRSNCVLDTSKLEKYTNVRSVHKALEDSIKNYTLN